MARTLDDVAARAMVSPATVSRALRGLSVVSEPTRTRIVAIAEELGYVVSPSASRLASGRTRTVGVVVPYIDRWFFGQVVAGVEQVLRANGFDLLLYNLGDEAGRDRFFAELPVRRRVDAVLVIALPLTGTEIAKLITLGVPVAVLGTFIEPFAGVRIDDVAGAGKAVQHLLNLGHREIALISGGTAAPMHFTTPMERRCAYVDVLASAGIDFDPDREVAGDFTVAGGQRAMADLLSRNQRLTAVFAISDEMAFGAMHTLRRCGLRVPEDVSVIGFDDHEMSHLFDLTTIAQPVTEQGVAAAGILLSQVSEETDQGHQLIQLATSLVIRGSTAPPAGVRSRSGPVSAISSR